MAAVVGVALLLVAVAAARRAHLRRGTPFDVLALYAALWGATLVLFAAPLIDYSHTRFVAWAGIYGSILTGLLAAWWVGRRPGPPALAQEVAGARLREAIDGRRLRLLWLLAAVLGLLGMASFVYAVSRVLPWSAVVTDPGRVRIVKATDPTFQSTYGLTKLLTYFNQIAFVLWTIGLRTRAFESGRWRAARYLGFGSIVPFLFTADRGLLIATVVWAGVLHLAWPQRIAPRRAIAVVLAGVLAAGVVVTAVGNRYGGSIDAHPEVAESLNTRAIDPLAMPYLYLTANIPTFGQLTADPVAPLNAGGMTILPLVKVADRLGAPGTPPVGNGVFYPIPFESFSNYGWLGTFWLDFRLLGVLLLPALVVGVAAALHRRLRERPGLAPLWLTSLLLYVIVFSPFANALSNTLTWQFLLLTPLIAVTLDRRAASGLRRWLAAPGRRMRLAAGAAAAGAVGLGAGAALQVREPTGVVEAELAEAAAKAQVVYRERGRYPGPVALAGQLGVSDPNVSFQAMASYHAPVTPGVITVITSPSDVFLRTRASDGRVYEVHRTEEHGGVTFGPGTRDG